MTVLEKEVGIAGQDSAVPEMQQAMLFEAVLSAILASLPQSNDAFEAACARSVAITSAAKIAAQCSRDPSFDVSSAVAGAVRQITFVMQEVEETGKEQRCAPAKAKEAESAKTVLHKEMIRVRNADGHLADRTLSEAEIMALQARADAMFAQRQLGAQMQMVMIDGKAYLQMPLEGEAGRHALIPVDQIRMIEVQMSGNDYVLTVHSVSAGETPKAPPHFVRRELPLPSDMALEILKGTPDADSLAAKLRANQVLLEEVLERLEQQEAERAERLKELMLPLMPATLQLTPNALPMCTPQMPHPFDLPPPASPALQDPSALVA